jgi:hypothetical protein
MLLRFVAAPFLAAWDVALGAAVGAVTALASTPGARKAGRALIDGLANLAAAVLTHPSVNAALADTVADGMNVFIRREDFAENFRIMGEAATQHQPELARKSGEEFPKVIGSFIQGVLSPKKPKEVVVNKPAEVVDSKSEGANRSRRPSAGSIKSLLSLPSFKGEEEEEPNTPKPTTTDSMEEENASQPGSDISDGVFVREGDNKKER